MTIEGLPLFPVTVVGSWPRTPDLLEALRQRQAGRLSWEDFNVVADKAVLECLKYQDDAGVDIVSDGEQRRDNFYSFVVDKMDGVKLMSLAELMDHVEDKASFDEQLRSLDAPAFAIHNATVVGRSPAASPWPWTRSSSCASTPPSPSRLPSPGRTCSPAQCG